MATSKCRNDLILLKPQISTTEIYKITARLFDLLTIFQKLTTTFDIVKSLATVLREGGSQATMMICISLSRIVPYRFINPLYFLLRRLRSKELKILPRSRRVSVYSLPLAKLTCASPFLRFLQPCRYRCQVLTSLIARLEDLLPYL